MKTRLALFGLVATLLVAGQAMAGQWLTPGGPGDQEPRFKPVPLYWFDVPDCPLVYRTVVDVPLACDGAAVLVRTKGYVYVCVDGKQVYAWAPKEKTEKEAAVPADPERIHEVDLGEQFTFGRHVLTVSAPKGGFVLDGALFAGVRIVAPLVSDEKWTVTKFMPTTILEDHPIMTLAYKGEASKDLMTGEAGPASPVKAGESWTADEKALSKAHGAAVVKRLKRDLDDCAWRLELLAKKGIYIVDATAYGWGGATRLPKEIIESAGRTLATAVKTSEKLASIEPASDKMPEIVTAVALLMQTTEQLSQTAFKADEAKAMSLGNLVAGVDETIAPADARKAIETAIGHPLNRLNESRYDRLGWMPHPAFADSRVGMWGVRINPVSGPTELPAPKRWRFATDPGDAGVRELRWSIGYNIENSMDQIDVPSSWTKSKDAKTAAYKGIAWYRTRIQIPDEWAGNDVLLKLTVAGQAQVWVNDVDVTELGQGEKERVYKLSPAVAWYGRENFIAVRVTADGEERGLVGPVTVSCPAVAGPQGKETPVTVVQASPLSPCVILTPTTEVLQIHHAGQIKLMIAGDAKAERTGYSAEKDGQLKANWVLLWMTPGSAAGAERPVLLVFEKNPVSITCETGVTKVKVAGAGSRVVAVRPWAKADPSKADAKVDLAAAVALWSRAALAVPTNYMNVTKVLKKGESIENISVDNVPKGPVLGHTVVYEFTVIKDQWNTEPLKIAPLPALCSLAIDTKFRNLKLDQGDKIELVQDGGLAGPYRGVKNADRVSYSYDIEAWPRLVGFTSWMFGPTDTGVPGNKREMELMAAIGSNCYRPQHNWNNQLPVEWARQGNKTRVEITADYCNAVGLNYMNNVEETLDRKELCRNDYDRWLTTVLYPHFEKLVPLVAKRPFWAVSYDLINEPFDHKAVKYNPAMKELTRRVRAIDKTHLCYIEPCEAWGAIQQLTLIKPTGDPLTMYSFHDYNFRLEKSGGRWPSMDSDISTVCEMWWPAFEFAVKYGYGMHCGEFGGFYAPTDDQLGQKTMMNDFFKVFDQFGMHSNYYPGRGMFQRLADGSQRPINVVHAYREYFRRPDFNMYYPRWPGQPEPPKAK